MDRFTVSPSIVRETTAWITAPCLVFALLVPHLAHGGVTVAIETGAVWRYHATGEDLSGSGWQGLAFVDSTWPSGPGPLGYGEPYIATTIPFGPKASNKYRTSYFRRTFEVSVAPESVVGVRLAANYDHGFVAYVNGVEVARRAMPPDTFSYATFASMHEGGAYETIQLGVVTGLVTGTNVLAVEVHQASVASSELVMDMELAYFTGPAGLTRGPYLQRGTPTGVVVRWRTDRPTDGWVEWSTAIGGLVTVVEDPKSTTEHQVGITGLAPDTRYFYSVGSSAGMIAGGDSAHSFVTSPEFGIAKPTRLWVIGDSGTGDANARQVRDAYAAYAGERETDLWLMLGDNAYPNGTDSSYQVAVFDMYPQLLRRSVLWPTRGNHDLIHAGENNDYYEIFSLPRFGESGGLASGSEAYYSFDYGNLHLVCLDSQESDRSVGGAMMTWLANDLAVTSRDWIIAFWHHPPYSKGSHDSDDSLDSGGRMQDMRENALPILEAGGVDLVLTGHSHSYERSYLLNGHYGTSGTLTETMKVNTGDGRPDGDGFYAKPLGNESHRGAVYAVAGSSGRLGGGTFDHPVMITSLPELGSMVIDVDGNRLDARFLSSTGVVRDSFTIVKSALATAGPKRDENRLRVSLGPNPFAGGTWISYMLPRAGGVRLSILDVAGRRLRTVSRGFRSAGPHEAVWDGRDEVGRALGAGVYFVMLEAGVETCSAKLVIAR